MNALRASVADAGALLHYPNAYERALQGGLARRVGCEPAQIVIGNGAAALIEAFVRVVAPRRCLVPQPAFSEYGRALGAQGCETIAFPLAARDDFALDVDALTDALRRSRPDACIVTNPHNPSGALVAASAMRRLIATARDARVALLLDEAFVDYVPEVSVTTDMQSAGDGRARGDAVFVLRSLTKFYAMPGLRVGYGVASAAFGRAVASRVPSWSVSSLAAIAAMATLEDEPYERATRTRNASGRERLARDLSALGARDSFSSKLSTRRNAARSGGADRTPRASPSYHRARLHVVRDARRFALRARRRAF